MRNSGFLRKSPNPKNPISYILHLILQPTATAYILPILRILHPVHCSGFFSNSNFKLPVQTSACSLWYTVVVRKQERVSSRSTRHTPPASVSKRVRPAAAAPPATCHAQVQLPTTKELASAYTLACTYHEMFGRCQMRQSLNFPLTPG